MINPTVLMSDTQHFSTEAAINPYYSRLLPNKKRAQLEHTAIQHALEAIGVNVVKVASPSESQDGVYTANWALVRDDTAILARLPAVRQAEEAYAEQVLRSLGKKVITLPQPWRFSGQGDALACGNYLLCGQGYRSDEAAQAYAAHTLGYERVQLQTLPQRDTHHMPVINSVSGWPDSFFYDIDLALAILRAPSPTQAGLIAYCSEAFTDESRDKLENLHNVHTLHVSYAEATEAFALNLVSNGKAVVMTNSAPLFQSSLEVLGFTAHTPEIHELSKGGGYIRCTTLTLASS